MRRFIWIIIISSFIYGVEAQELKCNVQVVSQKVQGTNKQVFETLQNAVFEFMNNKVWTGHIYGEDERIECNLLLNITEQLSADEFSGSLQIQSRRPVFNSNYHTTMFNFVDNDLRFRYIEFEPLEFDLNSFTSNLTSILAFYAYFIIALDYDSFSLEGGTPYYEAAEKVVTYAQNQNQKGWKPVDDMAHRNRYWLVKDIMDNDYELIREFYYRYHRHGLDVMDSKMAEGREEILKSLEILQKVYREKPDPYMHTLRLIFDAKADEFSKVYSESFPEEKNRAYNILVEMDQGNNSKYKTILEDNNQGEF
ncbi:MAG: DUF4835 family protein [Bacteroidales bacterium]